MKIVYMFLMPLILCLGCTFSNGIPHSEMAALDHLGRIIIDDAKEDVERVVAASNYCEAVRHCLKRRIAVPKSTVLQSFLVDEQKWKSDVFAYGFRLESSLEADFPHNACTVVCYFDGDKVYSIYWNLGIE